MAVGLFQAPGDALLGGDKALERLEKAYDERDAQDTTNFPKCDLRAKISTAIADLPTLPDR